AVPCTRHGVKKVKLIFHHIQQLFSFLEIYCKQH
ncbi:uncharacterized protein METZ01_LOCUS491190, partial [marine metagenome]